MSPSSWLASTSRESKGKKGGIQKRRKERHKEHFQKRNLIQSSPHLRRNTMATPKHTGMPHIRAHLEALLKKREDQVAVDMVMEIVQSLQQKNNELELRIHKILRQQYRKKSEGISTAQLMLSLQSIAKTDPNAQNALDELGQNPPTPPNPPSPGEEKEPTTLVRSHTRKRKRREVPPHITRCHHHIRVEDQHRICQDCGQTKTQLGHETSEVLEFIPARFVLHDYHLEKLHCRPCGSGFVTAPRPHKTIDRGLPGPGLLATLLVDKFADGLPLYRQIQRFERAGMRLPDSTIGNWTAKAADALKPIAKLLEKEAKTAMVLHADATGISVLDRDHPNNIKKGSLLGHVGDNGVLYFKFTPNQKKEGAQAALEGKDGYIAVDGAGVYKSLFKAPDSRVIEIGCWMHARRYFEKVENGGDARGAMALYYIKRMYQLEQRCRYSPWQMRTKIRQEESKPIMEAYFAWAHETIGTEPPGTAFYKALNYSIRQEAALRRYVEDGRLPMDNGPAERAIRSIAVTRKNYLFVGSDPAGERAAIVYTVLGSCKLAGVDPHAYLRDVLDKLAHRWKAKRLAELLPKQWQASRDPPGQVAA